MTPLYRVKNLLAGAVCLLLAVLGGNCLGVGLCGLFVLPWAPVVNGRAALPLVLTGLALTAAMALPAQAFRPRYRLPLFAAGVGLGLCTLELLLLGRGLGQMLPSDKALPVWLPVLAVLAGGWGLLAGVVLRLRRRQKMES